MRTFEFSGGCSEKIQIDDTQDIALTIAGGSEITGIVRCPDHALQLTVGGGSAVELYGECQHLIIKRISGGCSVNLRQLYCREATIELVEWGTLVELDVSQIIHTVCLKTGSKLKLSGQPHITNMSLHSGSVIEQVEE